jgi:hypothetical protein
MTKEQWIWMRASVALVAAAAAKMEHALLLPPSVETR